MPRGKSSPARIAVLVTVIWAMVAADAFAQGSAASDRAVLETLYDATGGASWTDSTNWKSSAPLSSWHGATTDTAGRVTGLDLRFNGLAGSIPPEMGGLARLRSLNLGWNELSGSIPHELGRLVNLEELHLAGNELTRSIPGAVGSLANLVSLDLGWNELSGPIPVALGSLVNLKSLRLGLNSLTGPIPGELGRLVNLESLYLSANALTGPIPGELGGLVNLELLYLSENDLTGPIPGELGGLVNLEELRLNSNGLTGAVPAWLGNMVKLKRLNLSTNALTGSIPGELGNIANLELLSLAVNPLTGVLPQRLMQLSRLTRLNIWGTAACAPADARFQEWLGTIDFLGATCNRPPEPVGTIPAQSLTDSGPALGVSLEAYFSDPESDSLSYVAASSHAGTVTAFVSGGTVWLVPVAVGTATVTVTARDPDGLSATQTMAVMTVASAAPQSDHEVLEAFYDATGGAGWTNSINWKTLAPLDEWYGVTTDNAGRVTGLYLRLNGLVGPIPPALGSLPKLQALNLEENALTGPIPPALGSLLNLEELYLGWNDLTGSIPSVLGSLVNLKTLDVAVNGLTGPIPGELGSLLNLEELDLGWNDLTGSIPSILGSLVNLKTLEVAVNGLTGPIPGELGNLVNLELLVIGNDGLTGPIPGELGSLENLRVLVLGGVALTGPIPASLGNLSQLRNLFLQAPLTGPIPRALRNLTNLEWLALSDNALTGPIPGELGSLANLRRLDLRSTALTGPIPTELGDLENLESLDLSYSWGVTGPLPPGLRLPRLQELDIPVTQACAPAAWRDWLATIDFTGRLCGGGGGVTIDLAVIYTVAARQAYGGTAAIEAGIDLWVAEANQAYAASGVHHRLALVATTEAPYAETGNSLVDLARLERPADGHLDEAHALRDRVGADLVQLVVGDSDVCGRGYVVGAFSLFVAGCGGSIFTHELGHNMGLWHDRYTSYGPAPNPAYGYVNQRGFAAGAPRSGRWFTLMSYNGQCLDAYVNCSGCSVSRIPARALTATRWGFPSAPAGSA